MRFNDKKVAGTLLFVGAVQFIVAMVVAEASYPYYSVAGNYISDLGVGSTALLFNSSVFVLGVMMLASVRFIQRAFGFRLLAMLLILTGIGAVGVGLFPETAGRIHFVFSLITFLFGGLSAIAFYKVGKPPFSYMSIVLGTIGIVALILFGFGIYLGLGWGGMERMIAYPILLCTAGFGGHLISFPEDTVAASKT